MKIFINNKQFKCEDEEMVLDVAERGGVKIPTLCKHPDLSVQANCRVCLVEVEGRGLVTACSTKVEDGMKVTTDTKDVERARRMNLQLIYAEHIEKCATCIWDENCKLQDYAKKYGADFCAFPERTEGYPEHQFGDTIVMDNSKCIECRNCEEMCRERQAVGFFDIKERGHREIVKPTNREKVDCIYCGQCVVHCPVGALQEVTHWPQVEELLGKREDKLMVAQIAPSIRVSIGEEFGMGYGEVVTGQLVASLRALGFDAVFDVNLGADMTTYEEARELIEWLEKGLPRSDRVGAGKDRPMFTSCCPGWVRFVEFFYPEFISHLTSTRSPQIISGILAKTYWVNSQGKRPKDVQVVSIMPCIAKKHEIALETHKIDMKWCLGGACKPPSNSPLHKGGGFLVDSPFNVQEGEESDFNPTLTKGGHGGVSPVDYVLTTREYAYLLRKYKIDFKELKSGEPDNPLGESSGAAAIYGASGGVMESALRSADYMLRVKQETGSLESVLKGKVFKLKKKAFSELQQNRIDFEDVRGQKGLKEAQVDVAGVKLKIAVVNGLCNAKRLLDNLQAGRVKYDYVEVMACPGGCIGGGGQPVPTSASIRKQRADALYKLAKNLPLHSAHENQSLQKVYRDYIKGDEKLAEEMFHCGYKVAERAGYKKMKN